MQEVIERCYMFDSTALAMSTCLESVRLERGTVIRKFTSERGSGDRLGRMTIFLRIFPNISHIAGSQTFPIYGFLPKHFLYTDFSECSYILYSFRMFLYTNILSEGMVPSLSFLNVPNFPISQFPIKIWEFFLQKLAIFLYRFLGSQ